MKRIFNIIAVLVAGVLVASCYKPEIGASSIELNKAEAAFEATSPAAVTLTVTANGDWYVYAPDWITAEPVEGSGNGEVKLTAKANTNSYGEVVAPRKDVVTVWSIDGPSANLSVSQNGLKALDVTRTYAKVTKADDIDLTKKFIIVADNGGTLQAMTFFNQTDKGDAYYSYIDAEKVAANDEGVIEYAGNKIQYTLETATGAEGYFLTMPNGFYLYQNDDTYQNFYSTQDATKASRWTIAFEEDGTAKIVNASTTGNPKTVVYDKDHNNFGGYVEKNLGPCIIPSLYIDQAAPSMEILRAAEKVTAISAAGEVKISVNANCDWTVRNHDSWVKDFTKSGTDDGDITVTLEANTTGKAREAKFQIIGEETSIFVTLVQMTPCKTIGELNKAVAAGTTNYEIVLKDVIVKYVNGSNAFLVDETGGILLYKSGHGLTAGKKINGGISGTATVYNNLNELTSIVKGSDFAETDATADEMAPKEITFEELKANFDKYVNMLVLVKGVEITTGVSSSAKSGEVKQGEITFPSYLKGSATITTGSKGDLVCVPAYNKTTKQVQIWAQDHFTASEIVTSLKVADLSIEVGESKTVTVTKNTDATLSFSSTDTGVATVDADGKVTGVAAGETTITVSAPAVTGTPSYTAASITFKVTVTAAADKRHIGKVAKLVPGDYYLACHVPNKDVANNNNEALVGWHLFCGSFTSNQGVTEKVTYDETTEELSGITNAVVVTLEAATNKDEYYISWEVGSTKYYMAHGSSQTNLTRKTSKDDAQIFKASDGVAEGIFMTGTLEKGISGGIVKCSVGGSQRLMRSYAPTSKADYGVWFIKKDK